MVPQDRPRTATIRRKILGVSDPSARSSRGRGHSAFEVFLRKVEYHSSFAAPDQRWKDISEAWWSARPCSRQPCILFIEQTIQLAFRVTSTVPWRGIALRTAISSNL